MGQRMNLPVTNHNLGGARYNRGDQAGDFGGRVLIVGGGTVAARKLAELLRCGAAVTVVAPEISALLDRPASALKLEKREFRELDLPGNTLVFACTDDSRLNARIAELCRTKDRLSSVKSNRLMFSTTSIRV